MARTLVRAACDVLFVVLFMRRLQSLRVETDPRPNEDRELAMEPLPGSFALHRPPLSGNLQNCCGFRQCAACFSLDIFVSSGARPPPGRGALQVVNRLFSQDRAICLAPA